MRVTSDNISTLFSLLLLLPLSPAHVIEKRSSPVLMGAASTFGAIADTTITNTVTTTGHTVINGNCGTCTGTSITNFPPGICTGIESKDGTLACNAIAACQTAYNNAKGLVSTQALASGDLGGLTLAPGVYTFPTSAATLSTTVTLNGATNPDGQFVFQIASTFMTGSNSKVVLENGAQACNVYFQVGSSATIGTNTTLEGNVLAYASVVVGNEATNHGTLCGLTGAVNLENNTLTAVTICTT